MPTFPGSLVLQCALNNMQFRMQLLILSDVKLLKLYLINVVFFGVYLKGPPHLSIILPYMHMRLPEHTYTQLPTE